MQSQQNFFQFKDEYFSDAVNRNKFLYLKNYIIKNRPKRILDVGSGKGITCLELHDLAEEIHGIEYCRKNTGDAKRFKTETEIDNVFFHSGDGRKIPFKDNYFDLVICSQVLEHIENPGDVIKEIIRVTNDKVLIDIPTPLWELWQLSYWTWNKIKNPGRTLKRYNEAKKQGKATIKRAFQPAHVNKWSPWRWKNLIESSGLKIEETYSCYMSPTKKFNLLGPVEKRFKKSKPFTYMGMIFFIEAKKITWNKEI